MKRKKEKVIKCINALNKDSENTFIKAEEKWNSDLLINGNSSEKSLGQTENFKRP